MFYVWGVYRRLNLLNLGDSPGRGDWYDTFDWCSQPPAMHGSSSTVLETENVASLRRLVIESEPSSPEVCCYFAMMVI